MVDQEEEERKAKLRQKIEFQVACEEKAFRIVTRLIENPVEQHWFVDSLQYITPSHYHDVVEERAVSTLCGYPLCPKPLEKVPSQKYFISTKSNKVYDIEERKHFCSGRCYKASQYIGKQISSEPVWARKKQPRRVFDLLPLSEKVGKLGEEVKLSMVGEISAEMQRLERMDHYQQSLRQMEQFHRNSEDERKKSKPAVDSGSEHRVDSNTDDSNINEGCVYDLDKAMHELGIDTEHVTKQEEDHQADDKESKFPNVSAENDVHEKSEAVGTGSVKQGTESLTGSSKELSDTVDGDKDINAVETGVLKKTSEAQEGLLCNKFGKGREEVKMTQSAGRAAQESKTEYLMRLLDRKKSLLAKMADIQPASNMELKDTDGKACDGTTKLSLVSKETEAEVKDENDSYEINVVERNPVKNNVKIERRDQHISCKQSHRLIEDLDEKSAVKDIGIVAKNSIVRNSSETKPVNLTVLQVICRSLKSWLTKETLKYLMEKEAPPEAAVDKTEFEKQYRALVAKVDAQEREFSDLIGEESLEPDVADTPSAPAPMYDVLKQEMAGNQLRVREFMKGSFTYKEGDNQETQKTNKPMKEVVLPTVDKYDQRLIRQRIALDRINKVLPDLLSPLELPVGDVYSDIRRLTDTCCFTRENILFKPAEWTVVTLIILKLLSRRQRNLSEAFTVPAARNFLKILLSGIQTDVATLEQEVELLLKTSAG